ncbi:uncharacterized protein LOC128995973 [Macrosteles quadrilineatus]|uniref:uncharacterized protein LOC128995973 n=1 Tax=Macrosteles quadrilineatus TaxID=74068 RepID=UPI0023E27046|nr:uncharacterized protein LOC128995973 [Macrosteles quadrilineatus]
MGGVWCKTDKNQRTFSHKQPFNTTLSRWTDQVRQAYRKPKHHHRPPRPPNKPLRTNERLTISSPTLVPEDSTDGWRSMTLVVPEAQAAPVPPPRKKRRKNKDLERAAVSMDDLNLDPDCLSKSTISLPDLSSRTTMVVTPILESRVHEDEENIKNLQTSEEDIDQPEIIPIENETLFSSRTLLHSSLGYVDKLSAISEVSAESGFEDKENLKFSEESSVTSVESVRETLNILAHIQDINNVCQVRVDTANTFDAEYIKPEEKSSLKTDHVLDNEYMNQVKENKSLHHLDVTETESQNGTHANEVTKSEIQNANNPTQNITHVKESSEAQQLNAKDNNDIREKTAVSKKAWLQNILNVDSEPYFTPDISKDRRGSENSVRPSQDVTGPNSLPNHLHLMPETKTAEGVNSSPLGDTNHSVLLDILQNNKESDTANFCKEESIFLTNTKTNIIYKSLSSDKLTDHSGLNGSDSDNELSCKTLLSDYSFQTPKLAEADSGLNSLLDKRSNVVSSFDFKEIKGRHFVDVQSSNSAGKSDSKKNVNGETLHHNCVDDGNSKETVTKKDSINSSRRSSITDSLHEFEMSIYDMLKESKKNENSSDEEESLKIVK